MKDKIVTRDECKKIQLDILEKIAQICETQNLNYYIQYGSLLGAVRHGGFIPWDDDIDIVLKRSEYDKLIAYLKDCHVNSCEWLSVLDFSVKGYYYTFAKAVDNRTVAKMDSNVTEHGIWVDIFPVDRVPNSKLLKKIHVEMCYFLRGVTLAMTTDFSSQLLGKKTMYKRILNIMASLVGKERICKIYDKIMRMYSTQNTKEVACLFSPYRMREVFAPEILFAPQEYEFEDRKFKGSKNYDAILTQLYGDYMKLPPEEKRRTHSITAWYVK